VLLLALLLWLFESWLSKSWRVTKAEVIWQITVLALFFVLHLNRQLFIRVSN
jgi:di/tricarboxylate transporter